MDDAIFRKQNFGNRLGFGVKPALLIVDFVNGFNDPELFGGGNIGPAITATVGLLEAFRGHKLPIAHTRVVFAADGADGSLMCAKVPSLRQLTETAPAGQIVTELTPKAGELIVRKTNASGFHGTTLAAFLAQQRVDTLVIAGCTTSGCVRASVVDSMAYGYRPVVPIECVGDRSLAAHESSLFDMGQKYADVMPLAEVLSTLGALVG